MSHYKSHNIKATWNVCKVTFGHLTSLSTHLDNAHLPPLCRKCHHSFSNVWELNKHAETQCTGSWLDNLAKEVTTQQRTDSLSELKVQEKVEMRPVRSGTSGNSVEYIVGEDDKDADKGIPHQTVDESTDDSTSSDSDDDEAETWAKSAEVCSNAESDGGLNSSSTDNSSDSSDSPPCNKTPPTLPSRKTTICSACGRGPFRSIKLHLLHCTGMKIKYQCSLCKKIFPTERFLNQHYMLLYSCDVCNQVFSYWSTYFQHQCPKGTDSPVIKFCSESMPKACNICKSFFTTDKTLLNHVTRVHTSVVSTKLCIITNKKVSPGVSGTAVQSATNSSGRVLVPSNTISHNLNVLKQVINGKLSVEQTYAGSVPTVVRPSPSSLTTSSSDTERPLAPICMAPAAAPVRSGKEDSVCAPSTQPVLFPPSATDETAAAVVSHPVTPPVPTIIAMFENDSQELALMKRMNTGWRSKASYPCRQCGAIFRQPSLNISHRYLHRGRRSHRCQCGRAFKHRLHLLRHCVQHAEAISYICVYCGETFTGAKLLAQHMKGKSQKKCKPSSQSWKHGVKRKCRMPFTCDCGQMFFRPSAYIWHQLKNLWNNVVACNFAGAHTTTKKCLNRRDV